MFCGQCLWWAMPPNKNHGSAWNTIWISTDRMNLCQTHCKQVPDFFPRLRSRGQVWTNYRHCYINRQYNWLLPVPTYFGCYFSGPLPLRSLLNGPPISVRFRESLVVRLYSEIDQIHLSIEAHCVTTLLPLGDCHTLSKGKCQNRWEKLHIVGLPL